MCEPEQLPHAAAAFVDRSRQLAQLYAERLPVTRDLQRQLRDDVLPALAGEAEWDESEMERAEGFVDDLGECVFERRPARPDPRPPFSYRATSSAIPCLLAVSCIRPSCLLGADIPADSASIFRFLRVSPAFVKSHQANKLSPLTGAGRPRFPPLIHPLSPLYPPSPPARKVPPLFST